MTTRRILKRTLVCAAKEVIDALERCLSKKVLNRGDQTLGKAAEIALTSGNFQLFPLSVDSEQQTAFHLVFEPRGGLTLFLRGDNKSVIEDAEREYMKCKSAHSHVQVRFVVKSHKELKQELLDKWA